MSRTAEGRQTEAGDKWLQRLVSDIAAVVPQGDRSPGEPVYCPLIVVLDGVQTYYKLDRSPFGYSYSLERLVDDLRKMRALVILLSSDEEERLSWLAYLADVIIDLEYRYTDTPDKKLLRLLKLRKTRHQVSRTGAHVYHLSGPQGFRISPHIVSQADEYKTVRPKLPVENCVIDVLDRRFRAASGDVADRGKLSDARYLDLFRRSHILLHGHGSGAKSAFGLKILAAPILDSATRADVVRLRRER